MILDDAAMEAAILEMKRWMCERNMLPGQLPATLWDLPYHCPLWRLGLTASQAAKVIEVASIEPVLVLRRRRKGERYRGNNAGTERAEAVEDREQ